jgi:hypothetical protein
MPFPLAWQILRTNARLLPRPLFRPRHNVLQRTASSSTKAVAFIGMPDEALQA